MDDNIDWMLADGNVYQVPYCSKCLVNDLDLLVIREDGSEVFSNGLSERDSINNVEKIVLNAEEGEKLIVRVDPSNLFDENCRTLLSLYSF